MKTVLRNPKTTIINLSGLAIGIAACICILLFVKFEGSYDSFFVNSEQIYRLRFMDSKNGQIEQDRAFTSPPMGHAFHGNIPEIKSMVRVFPQMQGIIGTEGKKFEEQGICYVDSNFFEMFSVPLLMGNPKLCLAKPHTAVLSKSFAHKYFGNENLVGKTFELNEGQTFEVTGVYEDIPGNSHFNLNIMLSYASPTWLNTQFEDTWDMFFVNTYVWVDKGADIEKMRKMASEIANLNKPESYKGNKWEIRFQPLEDIHLHTNFHDGFNQSGNAVTNKILVMAAVIVLLLAWLNYISIANAQSLDRAREVGVKKVMGSCRGALMRHFLVESFLLNLLAVFIALDMVLLVKAVFSKFLEIELSFGYWDFGFVCLMLLVFVLGSFLSGFYPAFVMSSFSPVQVLRGKFGVSSGRVGFRKIILGFQFAISAILIFIALVVYLQTQTMLNKDLGIDIKNTLVLRGSNLPNSDSVSVGRIESFKQALKQFPEVTNVACSNSIPGNVGFVDGVWSDMQSPEDKHQFSVSYVDWNYLSAFSLKPFAGRLFSNDFPSDTKAAIISKSGVSALGFRDMEDALGHQTNRDFGDRGRHIVGVIGDYRIGSWKSGAEPMIFYLTPKENNYFTIKLDRSVDQSIIEKTKTAWTEFFGDKLFRYFELEDSYKMLYRNELRKTKVLGLFAVLGMFVACMGLWGLAYFTITNRTKEIGIRKIWGFTTINIVNLINIDFVKIVFVSYLSAMPFAWWLAQKWLLGYETRISIDWWLLALPFAIISIITLITISFYAIKTALTNPSDVIRCE